MGVLLIFNSAHMLDECSCGSECQECDACDLPECECVCDDDTKMPEGEVEDEGADEFKEDEDLDDQDDEVDDGDDKEEDDEGF